MATPIVTERPRFGRKDAFEWVHHGHESKNPGVRKSDPDPVTLVCAAPIRFRDLGRRAQLLFFGFHLSSRGGLDYRANGANELTDNMGVLARSRRLVSVLSLCSP